MINALAEEIDDKAGLSVGRFRRNGVSRPGETAFYEWRTRGTRKQPYKIMLRNGALCAFAGPAGRSGRPRLASRSRRSPIVTTTGRNKLVSEVNETQLPVIIAPADYQRWLTGPRRDGKSGCLVPYTGTMTIAPVSDRVNNIKEDDVGLIAPMPA